MAQRNDDTPIELYVEAKAQWNLLRKDNSIEIQAPLSRDNWLLKNRLEVKTASTDTDAGVDDDHWLSQVEIITSSGPHRRLWMGPQFIFKTYNTPSGYKIVAFFIANSNAAAEFLFVWICLQGNITTYR